MSAKKIITGIITLAVIGGIGTGGYFAYRHFAGARSDSTDKVYVQKVSAVNTVYGGNLFATEFAGVIVAQKTVDVKYDQSKTIDEILVAEGDTVKKGDKLLTYNVEAIQLEIESAQLEVERMQNTIQTNETEIAQLEQEKRTATGDAQVSYTTQILNLQSENARNEYDIKAKNVEIQKLQASLKNAYVTAPIDGTVKSLKDTSSQGQDMYDYSENADVIMTIAADGDFRVKGVFNEQNSMNIYQGAEVLLKSRLDDTQCRGTISEIDTSPQQSSGYEMYSYGNSDEQTTASKYAFYVAPESLDGFMLGQHILIETGAAAEEDPVEKEGIWLYSDFVLWDGSEHYVWAQSGNDRIEKRKVEIGTVDEASGDCEIRSGLSDEDYIAFPADYIEAGMRTTTNQSDQDIPDNAFDTDEGDFGYEDFGGDFEGDFGEDFEEGDFADFDDDVVYDENGNMVWTDEDGQTVVIDPEGNPIEGGEDIGDGEEPENTGDEPDAEPEQ